MKILPNISLLHSIDLIRAMSMLDIDSGFFTEPGLSTPVKYHPIRLLFV